MEGYAMMISDDYKNIRLLLKDRSNSLLGLPETKIHLEIAISDSLARRRRAIVIGGLRNIGKTVILKQLANEFDNSLYLSFQSIGTSDNDVDDIELH